MREFFHYFFGQGSEVEFTNFTFAHAAPVLVAVGIILLFFAIGFYWIFQVIEIDQHGICVKILQKTIRKISWDAVVIIEEKTVMKNPAYVVIVRNPKPLNIDRRKKVLDAINLHSNGQIKISN